MVGGLPAGRPTSLTPELHAKIVKMIRQCAYPATAAQAAGVTARTYWNWLQWGEEGREPYAEFFHDIKEARHEAERRLVRRIELASVRETKGQWQAAAWILERTRGKSFVRQERVEQKVELDTTQLSDEEVQRRYLEALERGKRHAKLDSGKSAGESDAGCGDVARGPSPSDGQDV